MQLHYSVIMKLLTINFIKYVTIITRSICFSIQLRRRAQSTISLRKRLVRTNSEEKQNELKPSATTTSFRPKF